MSRVEVLSHRPTPPPITVVIWSSSLTFEYLVRRKAKGLAADQPNVLPGLCLCKQTRHSPH